MTHPLIVELSKLQDSLETQRLEKKFELKKAGSSDGAQNKPDPNSTTMSPTEIQLRAYVTETLSSAYGNVIRLLQSFKADLDILKADLNVEQDIVSIRDSGGHLLPRVKVETDSHKNSIRGAAEHFGNLTRSFKKFKSDNNLESKVPQYPEQWFHHSRLLFIGAALEFILAFPFYYEVAGTPIAAFGFAFLVVILNVLPIFIFGNLFRFKNHVVSTKKFGFLSLSVFCFGLFLAAILLAGHLRTAIGSVVEKDLAGAVDDFSLMTQAGKLAFSTFINSPLSLGGDVLALMFLIASFGFGIFTAWKAYTIDDEYPGYGALDRQRRGAEADLTKKRTLMFDELNKVFLESSQNTKKDYNKAKARCNDIVYQIAEYQNVIEAYNLFYQQANTNLKSALQIYRAANIYVRSTKAPAYFEEEIHVDGLDPKSVEPVRQSDIDLAKTLDDTADLLVNVYNETQRKMQEDQKLLYEKTSSDIEKIIISAQKGE